METLVHILNFETSENVEQVGPKMENSASDHFSSNYFIRNEVLFHTVLLYHHTVTVKKLYNFLISDSIHKFCRVPDQEKLINFEILGIPYWSFSECESVDKDSLRMACKI